MDIKSLVFRNKNIYNLASSLINIKYLFGNSSSVKGKNNKLKIHNTVLKRKIKILIKGHNNTVLIGPYVRLRNIVIEINGSGNVIDIGKNAAVYESARFLVEGDNCKILLSEKVTVGSANFFTGESDTNIFVGEDCMFSRDIKINTSDFHSIIDLETNTRINMPANIHIGNHVWVGHGANINKGALVSDNTVIGAYAVVNKKFTEPNILIAGQPAKIIKTNINWDREKLK